MSFAVLMKAILRSYVLMNEEIVTLLLSIVNRSVSMAEIKETKCSCGHLASTSYREKDKPYSSYGIWMFNNLDCISRQVEKPVQMSYSEALNESKPEFPACAPKLANNAIHRMPKSYVRFTHFTFCHL